MSKELNVGDRVIINSIRDGYGYGVNFVESVVLNKDAGVVIYKHSKTKVDVRFDRNFEGLWRDRCQTLHVDTLVLESSRSQEITGRVMVIGEL